MALKYIEELNLDNLCIKERATPNQNNNVTWTTKIFESPDSSNSPIGQMSTFMRVIYVITPGKDRTAQTTPTGYRNCDVIVEQVNKKFIEQCDVFDAFALKHAIANKDYYWEGEELTDKQVAKRQRKLIVPTKDGDKLVFKMKLKPNVKNDKKTGKIVKNPRGTVMIRVDENDEEAEEPTSIDEVHSKPETRDYVQNICDFVCFYRSDAYFGINVHVPQGWHKTQEYASYSRNKRKRGTRSSGADMPELKATKEEETTGGTDETQKTDDTGAPSSSKEASADVSSQEQGGEDDYGDDYE